MRGTSVSGKLNNKQGISLTLTLLVLLLCTVVGSVILSSATASVTRAEERRADDQAYMTLSSAEELISEGLGSMSYTFTGHSMENVVCGDLARHPSSAPDPDYSDELENVGSFTITGGNAAVNASLLSELKSQAVSIRRNNGSYSDYIFSVTTDDLNDVQVVMTMDEDYNLTFRLSTEGQGSMELIYKASRSVVNNVFTEIPHEFVSDEQAMLCQPVCRAVTVSYQWAEKPEVRRAG